MPAPFETVAVTWTPHEHPGDSDRSVDVLATPIGCYVRSWRPGLEFQGVVMFYPFPPIPRPAETVVRYTTEIEAERLAATIRLDYAQRSAAARRIKRHGNYSRKKITIRC
jgi:hypothetical protein